MNLIRGKIAKGPKAPSLAETSLVRIEAFGLALDLLAPADARSAADAQARLRGVYEPFLCTRPVPAEGVAVDVGAGFGSFALPFAAAFPRWRLWCFEPSEFAADLLEENLRRLGLGNVTVVRAAISARAPAPSEPLAAPDARALQAMCRPAPFRPDPDRPEAVLRARPTDAEARALPTVPPEAIAALEPDLLKLCAPFEERGIAERLAGADIPMLVGAVWETPRGGAVLAGSGRKDEVFLRRAGTPWCLRRDGVEGARDEALDVVVAAYDARDFIGECVRSILDGAGDDVRVIVVDDGSRDGTGELVRAEFAADARVRALSKPNGGCASARNYGRLHSNARHIAFVDADDLVEPGFFARLLDLARWTGAEVVQGGFAPFEEGDEGRVVTPSYERGAFDDLPTQRAAGLDFRLVPPARLLTGQPTIWRRVYRRDFLDNKNIWFPEHIRAYDDQIFHMTTLALCRKVPHVEALRYLYRQHPGQDIRQGDERHFHSLEMYRATLSRAIKEGWPDANPILRSFMNTVRWSCGTLRADLRTPFLEGAAELYALARRAFPPQTFHGAEPAASGNEDFAALVEMFLRRFQGLPDHHVWMSLDSPSFHPNLMRMAAATAV
ncbi:FkbM family methyltransferase [Oceanicella actignis]|uniref:Methyltransferase, FkbM family n=1 Tax=Oceanicella actignis TaxID=1189325 RepID=A0A1M7S1L0_9RHOB|nr:FkbM family methyltransferase [Oceanicella actignis]SES91075.1 methyltransferase, FkbM family [Oceanicella actignis]SHN52487.1 methyltransferase, FkbM family [Oceanicella actignis]